MAAVRSQMNALMMTPNDQHQRWEPAAKDSRIVTGLDGWLPSAECCGSAVEISLAWHLRRILRALDHNGNIEVPRVRALVRHITTIASND